MKNPGPLFYRLQLAELERISLSHAELFGVIQDIFHGASLYTREIPSVFSSESPENPRQSQEAGSPEERSSRARAAVRP